MKEPVLTTVRSQVYSRATPQMCEVGGVPSSRCSPLSFEPFYRWVKEGELEGSGV